VLGITIPVLLSEKETEEINQKLRRENEEK
jgi:hypothetical protein